MNTNNKTATTIEDIYFDVVKRPLSEITGVPSAPHCSHALQRVDTGAILHTCTDRYEIVKNEELVEPFLSYLASKYGKTGVELKVRSRNDALFYVDLILKEIQGEVQVGDMVCPVIEIGNSYNGMMRRFVKLGFHRLVCTNGMRAFSEEVSFSKKHFKDAAYSWDNQQKMMLKKLELMLQDYDKTINRFKQLNERRLTHKELEELAEVIRKKSDYPKKLIEGTGQVMERENQLGLETTAWLAYNAYNNLLFQDTLKLDEYIRIDIDRKVLSLVEDFALA